MTKQLQGHFEIQVTPAQKGEFAAQSLHELLKEPMADAASLPFLTLEGQQFIER